MFKFNHIISDINTEFVCAINNNIIGWLDYSQLDNNIHINAIFVDNKYRNKKIATKLLDMCLTTFKNYNISLQVFPFRDKPMCINKLKNFYFKYKFVEDTYNKNLLKLTR